MKGLLDADKKLQIQALEGLIDASKVLGLDPTRYNNALRVLRPEPKKRPKTARSSAKKPKKGSSSGTSKRRTLKSSEISGGRLVLTFDGPISEAGVRHFVLKRKLRYLYVFDLQPVRLPYPIKRFKGTGFREIRIAQFDPKRVRVVVETDVRYRPAYRREGNRFLVTLPGTKGETKKKKSRSEPKLKPSAPPAAVPSGAVSHPSALPASRLRRYTIVIDPGHGGKDSGAVGYHRKKEKDAVLSVAKRLKKVLERRGFHVYLTRSRDVFIPLKRRTHLANRKEADFFVSIHANAAAKKSHYLKSKGIETYFLSPARSGRAKRVAAIENRSEIKNVDRYTKEAYLSVLNREKIIESNKLAIDLQKQVLASLRSKYRGVVDNGVREGPFWVLVGAQMPAVLIEIGYITHPTEAKRLFNPNYQKLLAEGIANGIESYIIHNH